MGPVGLGEDIVAVACRRVALKSVREVEHELEVQLGQAISPSPPPFEDPLTKPEPSSRQPASQCGNITRKASIQLHIPCNTLLDPGDQ
jgi:hypothetical protein